MATAAVGGHRDEAEDNVGLDVYDTHDEVGGDDGDGAEGEGFRVPAVLEGRLWIVGIVVILVCIAGHFIIRAGVEADFKSLPLNTYPVFISAVPPRSVQNFLETPWYFLPWLFVWARWGILSFLFNRERGNAEELADFKWVFIPAALFSLVLLVMHVASIMFSRDLHPWAQQNMVTLLGFAVVGVGIWRSVEGKHDLTPFAGSLALVGIAYEQFVPQSWWASVAMLGAVIVIAIEVFRNMTRNGCDAKMTLSGLLSAAALLLVFGVVGVLAYDVVTLIAWKLPFLGASDFLFGIRELAAVIVGSAVALWKSKWLLSKSASIIGDRFNRIGDACDTASNGANLDAMFMVLIALELLLKILR